MVFAWAPERQLSAEEQTLLRLFVDNVAGDATTNLYKLFVDSQTRKLDLDAKSVFGWIGDGLGYPVFLGLEDVAAASLGPEKAALARQMVLEELGRIAAFADGSPELSEFNGRIRSRVVSLRRQLSRDLSSPPGFGQRGTGSGWMQHLDLLARAGGFRRSLALQPELDAIEQRLGSGKNFWRERLSAWKLTGAVPFTAVTRASPELLEREETERRERIAAEIGRLQALHGAAGEQETLRLYQGGYDAETAKLDELALKVETPTFLEAPPLTLDDLLEFKVEALPGGVPLVHSSFPNMSRATAGLALRLDGVPAERLVYLSALPELMIGTGVLEQGKPVSNEAMQERLRNEILGLEAEFSADFTRGRCELVLRGSGNTLAESRRAVQWMLLVLQHPDWRPENLPRIRDLVGQTLSELRNRMQQSEESWVSDPADAYRRQDHALLLAAESFLTRTHNLQRLRWLLEDAGPAAERDALAVWLGSLAGAAAGAPRSDLVGLLAALQSEGGAAQAPAALAAPVAALGGLPEGARKLAVQVAKDVELTLPGLPDASLAEDWAYLCRQIRADLLVPPASALAELDALRAQILKTGNARVFLISSAEGRQQLDASLRDLAGSLQAAPADPPFPPGPGLVRERLRQRDPAALQPVFVGLLNPNTQSGVFVNSAPGTSYADLEREPLLRYLAVLLYGGGGAHGIFMKTWGAGLAYSNGLSANLSSGRIGYYAERCPELPQTLRFVIGELKSARRDPALGEYAVAQAFPSRSALDYESRGEAIASNLVDGRGPEVVRRFRERLLELRREPKLTDALFDRLQAVVAAVLPGFGAGPPPESIENAVYMVIGPEKQMALYEQFLQSSVGPQARVHRLYPRDFWMPGPAANP